MSNTQQNIVIVAANFYPDITKKLVAGAMEELRGAGIAETRVTTQMVPGCFELPLACQRALGRKHCSGAIALGCALRGETDHYAAIMDGTTRGIMDVMLELGKPIGFGVIFAHTRAQALARCRGKRNYGRGAAAAVINALNTV